MRAAFKFGGHEIKAGSRASVDLPLPVLSTHTPMALPVHIVHGRREGPRLFVCAAIHGDEINGVEIIRRLLRLSAIDRLRGTLVAVPVVNVFGFVTNSRYLPDRRDLNRSFPGSASGSLAGRLADTFLREIVAESDFGIDLHTGAIHRDNFPQIRANLDSEATERLAHAFRVPVVINTGFRDGSLREAAWRHNVPVLVYEAGEALRYSEPCIRAGVQGVVRVMRELNMIAPSKRKAGRKDTVLTIGSTRWVRASQSGLLRTTAALGSQVKAGQTLGFISDPFGESEVTISSPSNGIVIGRTNLPAVHEGDAIFHVAEHAGKQVVARSLDDFEPEAQYEKGLTSELTDDPPIV